MSTPISVAIITFNEEKNIERCIKSVKPIADEIVVLDSFSNDRTKEICVKNQVNFIEHAFDGHIQQKNRVLTLTKYDHVLSLDADEALSEKALKQVQEIKENWKYDGYVFPRMTNYCGRWIKHSGWYPDKKLRLFDKTKGAWGGNNPHDKYELHSGETKLLKGDILHYSFYTVQQHLDQIDKFSRIGAKALFEHGKKYSILKQYSSAFAKFVNNYIIRMGFLDGKEGWLISKYSSYEKYLKFERLKELHNQNS